MSERRVGEDDIVITSRAINADGSGLRRLRWNAESDSWAWSPDGSKIAYRGGHDVYVMNANGTRPKRIARGAGWGFTWSPDGRRLAYVDPSAGIYVVDIARATKRKVALGRDVAWSPRADRLAFVQGETLVVTRADGTDQRVITSGVWAMPRWSPDGTRIAFPKEEGGLGEAAYLYVAEADGTNARPLTPKTEVFKYAQISTGRPAAIESSSAWVARRSSSAPTAAAPRLSQTGSLITRTQAHLPGPLMGRGSLSFGAAGGLRS